MIDLKFLEQLADLLNRTEVNSIEIRKRFWGTSIKISKNEASGNYHVVQGTAAPSAVSAVPPASAVPAVPAVPDTETANLVEIKSPMVGTFYAQPEPGADPYVQVGSRINIGQTLCIIEAMKIMNPLDAEVTGVIKEVRVDDAQPVEFGQVLFTVDPNG